MKKKKIYTVGPGFAHVIGKALNVTASEPGGINKISESV